MKRNVVIAISIAMILILFCSYARIFLASGQIKLYGGTLVVSETFNPSTFVQVYVPAGAWWSSFNIYDRLVEVDVDTGIHPGLAKSWDISADRKTYTFHLYENVTWHDGVKFTSADVKYTFDSILEEKGVGASQLDTVSEIETPDDYTVVIKLKTPDAAFLSKLGSFTGSTHIIAKHLYEGTSWEQNNATYNPIGTGPFKFKEFVSMDHYTLVANEQYFKGRPHLDQVIFRIIPSTPVAMLALEKGEIQWMTNSPPYTEISRLMKEPGVRIALRPVAEDMLMWFFNLQRKPFNDVRVRKALTMAINRDVINEKVYAGFCAGAKYVYSTAYGGLDWAINKNATLPDYDPAKAEALLDEAGYPRGADGIRFHTTLTTSTIFSEFEQVIRMMKDYLAAVGVDASITVLEYGSWWDKTMVSHDFDLTVGIAHGGPDPYILSETYGSGFFNVGGYNNSEVQDLFNNALVPVDTKERATYYYQAEAILAEDLPYSQLISFYWPMLSRTDFHGFFFESPFDVLWRLSGVWWEKGQIITPTPAVFPLEWLVVAAVVVVVVVAAAALYLRRRPPTKSK